MDQLGHNIVTWSFPTIGAQGIGVQVHLEARHVGRILGHRVFGIFAADHRIGPFEQLVTILIWHPEKLGDRLEGQFSGEIGDEVGTPIVVGQGAINDFAAGFAEMIFQR